MRRWRTCLLIVATGLAAACGRKAGGREGHSGMEQAAPQATPTPDTTPIEALRTPAGLVLKLEETPPPVTPSPAVSAAAVTPKAGA